jgi:Spy/CpxP family protein refolding chaperone
MKAKLPWILLMLVLGFSASYIVGFGHGPAGGGRLSDAEQIEIVAQKLGLDARQKAEYVRFRKDMAAQESQRMQAQLDRLTAMRQRMLSPDPTTRNGAEVADAAALAHRESMRANATRLREFMSELRPEQREKFFDLLVQSQTERLNRWKQTAQ